MSKRRRRRNSLRRKSSRCGKQSQSQNTPQHQSQMSISYSAVYKNNQLEKGESYSRRRERVCTDSHMGKDRGYEAHNREKIFRANSSESVFQDDWERTSTEVEEADKVMTKAKITTSVSIHDCEVSPARILFQNSCESADTDESHSSVSITTTKVICSRSKVEVEINEVMHSHYSDSKTTLVRDGTWRWKGKNGKWESTSNYGHHRQEKGNNHHFSISEINTDFNKTGKSQIQSGCQEERVCCNNCCEEGVYSHNCVVQGRFSSLYTLSDTGFHVMDQPLTNTGSCEPILDILPPHESADESFNLLDALTENIASCQISSRDNIDHQEGGMAYSALAQPSNSSNKTESVCLDLQEGESLGDGVGFMKHLSCSGTYRSLLQGHGMPVSRSKYTKEFIHNHERMKRLHNNSSTIMEAKPKRVCYVKRLDKRRHTFPGPKVFSYEMEEDISSYRESFSSDTLSPFFMQCLPQQAQKLGRLYNESASLFSTESSKFSEDSTGYTVSSSNFNGHRTCTSNSSTYGDARRYPSCSFGARESQEEKSSTGQIIEHRQLFDEVTVPGLMMLPSHRDSCTDAANHGDDQLNNSEVTESGFDEEMPEVEEWHRESIVHDYILKQRNLFSQVAPPSLNSYEECIVKDSINNCQSALLRECDANLEPNSPILITSTDFAPNRRKGSVMTCIIGSCEQRSIQNGKKPLEMTIPEKNQGEFSTAVIKATSALPIEDMEEEVDGNIETLNETKSSPWRSLIVKSNDSLQTLSVPGYEMKEAAGSPTHDLAGMDYGSLSQPGASRGKNEDKDYVNMEDLVTAHTETNGSIHRFQNSRVTDSTKRLSIPRSAADVKIELREQLRLPVDLSLKEQEDVLDHWAKRRKLFRESKQWSSAGGSSLTSIITEESVNSDDGRAVDISMRDIEDRGFYTETFHSASWIYRGDCNHPANSPRSLNNRPRPATIRERTVRIIKGTGDYPWGFRIQFSKPIVVTEVDTNGPAEEAGLLVGDMVLTVNGTDVTSVSHCEAAELAKQGPDILTLTIGSDISHYPSTPRPACRGYLYKRTQSGLFKGWRKRWFVLKHDCCLYYYRRKRCGCCGRGAVSALRCDLAKITVDEGKTCALAAVKLEGAKVGPDISYGKPFVIKCSPVSCARVYYFCATSNQEMKRWLEAMERAIQPTPENHVWIDVVRHNSNLPPLAIKNPECLGLLHQLDRNKDYWVQPYCILKDGCLYFYSSIRSTHAMGGIFLHGYTVREQTEGARCSTIELRPPSEEFKSFYLCAENTTETKRWSVAIKASINKWVLLHQVIEDFMNRPAEETRM